MGSNDTGAETDSSLESTEHIPWTDGCDGCDKCHPNDHFIVYRSI